MPNKSIPTLGDSNWGTPLNNHLSQLLNPSTGGINSFEQFSLRPTNLTTDDVGKTYLYAQTGNLHQWIGTEWKVLNESVINVKDYGAVGDGVTDDTLAVQVLLDKSSGTSNKSLFFPEGVFLINVTTKYQVPNFLGIGSYSTRIESYTPTGWAITITYNNNWQPFEIRDISFTGSPNRTKNGIQFGKETFESNDQFCAGLRLTSVLFDGLNIGIFKRYGNIGNHFESCDFRSCNFHYKSIGFISSIQSESYMNCGCDTFYKCEMDNSEICSIYIDGRNSGVNGQHIFRDCIFQYNKGFAFYVKNYDNENQLNACVGLKVENCWLEGNASASQVNVDDFLVTPRNLYFNKANAIFENCETQNIELIHSKITCINSGLKTYQAGDPNQEGIIKDNFSSIILNEFSFIKDIPYYVKNPQYIKQSIPTSVYCISAQRNNICYSDKSIIFSDSYSTRENIFCLGVSGTNVGKLVRDGTLFGRSLEIDINSSNNNQDFVFDASNPIIIPKNKYIFWSIDVKKISGDDISMFLLNATFTTFTVKSPNWTTLVGLGDTIGSANDATVEFVMFTKNLTTKFRLACLQILAFDTLQELHEYIDSLKFTIKTEKLISSGLNFPSTGDYIKGDLIYNTNPTPGGYVGWICTASGTPGTWKGFGLIQA